MSKNLLVTGGAGFIGSHCVVEFAAAGWRVVVLDDLSNGHVEAVTRAAELGGSSVDLVVGDIRSREDLDRAFAVAPIDAVVHFAARKSVPESVAKPTLYYDVNVGGTRALLDAMARHGVGRMVFSSSASVYGEPDHAPVDEDTPPAPMSPYGRTKLINEWMLTDAAAARGWSTVSLRYFNPVGAHPSGRIGEDARKPSNLVPIVIEAADGTRPQVTVFGRDYDTPDGSCIRDYIHIMDLAAAHRAAVEATAHGEGNRVYNVGTGRGGSVVEVLDVAREVTGRDIPAVDGPRRPGDPAQVVADPRRAERDLGWKARYGLSEMLESAWSWRQQNPTGYPRS